MFALVVYVAVVQPRLVSTPEGLVTVTVPTGVLVFYGLLLLVFTGAVRYVTHLVYERPLRGYRAKRDARSVLIVGAGDGGRLLLREILRNPDLGFRPVGFVDDDERKQHVRVDRGLEVLGTTFELPHVLDDVEPDEVLIAIPSAPGTLRARVVSACRARGVPVRTMPTVFELLQNGSQLARQVREVRVEDVLGREPVRMETELTRRLPHRPVRARDRGRRLDRRRAVPADLPRRAEPARPARPRRGQPVRDRARAGRGPARAEHRRGARRLQGRGAHAGGVRRATARPSSSTPPPTSTSA